MHLNFVNKSFIMKRWKHRHPISLATPNTTEATHFTRKTLHNWNNYDDITSSEKTHINCKVRNMYHCRKKKKKNPEMMRIIIETPPWMITAVSLVSCRSYTFISSFCLYFDCFLDIHFYILFAFCLLLITFLLYSWAF